MRQRRKVFGISVKYFVEVETVRRSSLGGFGTLAGFENGFELGGCDPAATDFDQGTCQVADHPIQKAVGTKTQADQRAFLLQAHRLHRADHGRPGVTGVAGKG